MTELRRPRYEDGTPHHDAVRDTARAGAGRAAGAVTHYKLVEHEACGWRWWGVHLPRVPEDGVPKCPGCGEANPQWHCIPAVPLAEVASVS